MTFLQFIDHLMHTTPTQSQSVHLSAQHDVWAAHAQVERMRRDINALDAAVSDAEARQLPNERHP